MDLVVPLEQVTVAIEGAVARFPVRRIYCVGRNYLDHIRETAGADERERRSSSRSRPMRCFPPVL